MPDSIKLITGLNRKSGVRNAPELSRIPSTVPVANTGTPSGIANGNSGVHDEPVIPHAASTPPVADTVTLSDTAKATLLQQQGESVEEIAATLGLPISEVMSGLSLIALPSLTFHP